jgi:hypothetical protein
MKDWGHVTNSKVAREGGPVRIKAASVVRYSESRLVLTEAARRGWVAESVGDYWILRRETLPVRRLSAAIDCST